MTITHQISRRRTFAIISHPDAGKTTLTEKFLLYGGALRLAGSVTARKNQQSTTSDWMELEKKRGISISSTVLQFEYNDYVVNILDTPGHRDFSEDTYRVLTAVDAVIMVIDAGKGIESQTRKLFEICSRREIPIFTFMNKLDRPAIEPLKLMDELESVLGIQATAMNWPIGTGAEFRGVFDRIKSQFHLFERVPGGSYRAPEEVSDFGDPKLKEQISETTYKNVEEELSMLDGAGYAFDQEKVLAGKLSPVFFGSAINNFGIQLLLNNFLDLASEPRPRKSGEQIIPVDTAGFSGFVFKIQANMDPKHRDRVAFIRICSGKFTRDMSTYHARTGKNIRLSSSHKLFGQERETVDEAYAGDIIGVVGRSDLRIGDTLTEDPKIIYNEIPSFAPECFAFLYNDQVLQFKRFHQGLEQLLQEGVVQSINVSSAGQKVPLLAAVGPLQFEVVQFRLESEYGVQTRLELTDWKLIRWLAPDFDSKKSTLNFSLGSTLAQDAHGRSVILFRDEFAERYFISQNLNTKLYKDSFV